MGIEGLKKAFERILQAAAEDQDLQFQAGDRWLTPHSCRHSLTALLAAGLPPLHVQAHLGWSSQEARILSRVQAQYTQLQLFRLEDVAAKIQELFGPKEKLEQARTQNAG